MIIVQDGMIKIKGKRTSVKADFAVIARSLMHDGGIPKEQLLHVIEIASMSESELDNEIEKQEKELFEILRREIRHE